MICSDTKWKQHLLRAAPALGLFIAAALLYGPVLGFEFVSTWDDDIYVIDNPWIRELNLHNVQTMFSQIYFGFYSPLHHLSYAIDYALWGPNPMGFHATNVGLHAVAASLVFLVVSRLTGRRVLALVVAALFVVHPVNVENVAWVSERKAVLAMVFFCATILAYHRFRTTGRRRSLIWTYVFFAAALLSKPIVVALPLLLVAWEKWLAPQPKPRLAWPLWPLFAMAGGLAAVSVVAQRGEGVTNDGLMAPSFLLGTAYPTMMPVLWQYVRLLIAPTGLCAFYDAQVHRGWLTGPVLLSTVAWIVVFATVLRRGNVQVRFWFAWFWICLLPVSNLIPLPVFYADRYMYAPSIGAFVLGVMAVEYLVVRWRGRSWMESLTGRRVLGAGCLAVVVAYAGTTVHRSQVWRNDLVLWEDTARKSPRIYSARLNLGVAYQNAGRLREAEREYMAAVGIAPTPEARQNLEMIRATLQSLQAP